MEFQMFEVLGMRLSITQEELKQLCLEILAEYTTELMHLPHPKHPSPSRIKEPHSRSPDVGDLPKQKNPKFAVPEGGDESDCWTYFDSDSGRSWCEPERKGSFTAAPSQSQTTL